MEQMISQSNYIKNHTLDWTEKNSKNTEKTEHDRLKWKWNYGSLRTTNSPSFSEFEMQKPV